MSDDVPSVSLRAVSRLALWWRLPRALGLATDGRKLILATIGLMMMWAGWDLLDRAFPTSAEITAPAVARTTALPREFTPSDQVHAAFRQAADPLRMLAAPVIATFELPSNNRRFLHALLATLWAVIVWAPVGGTIARIAVVESATGSRISLAKGIQFALYKLGALITAPLSPIMGIGFFTAFCALFGLLYRIPGPVGVTIAGALAFLPIGAGVLMALILIGLIAGWPLMIAGVAAEANDGFDALSRSYSYVLQRPGQYAVAIGIAWIFGALGTTLAMLAARLIVHLTIWAVSFGGPDARTLLLFLDGPLTRSSAGSFHYLWVSAVALLAYSWTFSYFWSASAQIYLLMRHEVDGAPWGDVALPSTDESPPIPLVVAEEIAAGQVPPGEQT